MTTNVQMSQEQLLAMVEELKKQNAALAELAAKSAPKGSIRIGQKGGVSVYGFGRHPVTLYMSQWEQLIEMVPEIKAFIEANASKLSVKPVK